MSHLHAELDACTRQQAAPIRLMFWCFVPLQGNLPDAWFDLATLQVRHSTGLHRPPTMLPFC
jgi:hypothetical protein